jgi:uncharacterized protein YggE
MRYLFCFIGAILFLASSAVADEPANRTITVVGSATVHYLPDAARIQFRILSSEADLDEAKQANQKLVKLVDEKLSALKIKDMKITFAPQSMSQGLTRVGPGGRVINPKGGGGGGGRVMAEPRNTCSSVGTLLVRETEMDKMADTIGKIEKVLLDAGVGGGQAIIDEDTGMIMASTLNVTFLRRDDAEFRDEALAKAVQSASQKAKALAKGGGVQIKEMLSIVESQDSLSSGAISRPIRNAATASSPTELEVTVRVTVRYSY